jgi:2-polyprenyl-6-methoxyphenol hydroxylase-like FAD-dependent oxidoreductase
VNRHLSPVGGVGVNLAVQDAVAAANILAAPLAQRSPTLEHLRAVQKRREFPTRVTQTVQLFVQNRFLRHVLASTTAPVVPWPLKLLRMMPMLRRVPARLFGLGVRPEHVQTQPAGR